MNANINTVKDRSTTNDRDQLIEMFLDATPNEIYARGRLATREVEGGIELISYGENVLAFANEKKIDFFVGHYGAHSPTVTRYIQRIGSLLNDVEGREVNVYRDTAPTLGEGSRLAESSKYIKNYIHLYDDLSAVEKDARAEVERALKVRMAELFG